jgi:hypothetical protein
LERRQRDCAAVDRLHRSGIEDFFDALMPVLEEGGEEMLDAVIALSDRHDTTVPPTD